MTEWLPHVTVASVVARDGRWLCVEERVNGASVLNQPAGHWERGESLIEAAIRETREETGWDIRPTALLGIYEHQPEDLPYTFLRFAFLAEPLQHHPDQPLDNGILRAVWLDYENLTAESARHRSPMVMRCINDARAGRSFPMELIAHLTHD